MDMTQTLELNILGRKLSVKSDEREDFVRAVEELLDRTIQEAKDSTKAVATMDLALLVSLNLASELVKTRSALEEVEKRSEELTQMLERRMSLNT
jgi:cell division protein ZapA (FtsZ GTPase activity inhibitor)